MLSSHHPSRQEGGCAELAPSTGFQIFSPILRFLLMQFVAIPTPWGYSLHYHIKAVNRTAAVFLFYFKFFVLSQYKAKGQTFLQALTGAAPHTQGLCETSALCHAHR